MTGVVALVFGWYFALVLGDVANSPARDIAYTRLMVPVVILPVILATVAQILIALLAPGEANAHDERDWLIGPPTATSSRPSDRAARYGTGASWATSGPAAPAARLHRARNVKGAVMPKIHAAQPRTGSCRCSPGAH